MELLTAFMKLFVTSQHEEGKVKSLGNAVDSSGAKYHNSQKMKYDVHFYESVIKS